MLENKVTELLGQLAEKLGVASEKVWEWALLQVKVDLITSIASLFLAIILTIVFTKYLLWMRKSWDDFSSDQEFWHITIASVLGTALAIFDVIVMCHMFNIPKLLINPEYVAFQKIISQLSLLK